MPRKSSEQTRSLSVQLDCDVDLIDVHYRESIAELLQAVQSTGRAYAP